MIVRNARGGLCCKIAPGATGEVDLEKPGIRKLIKAGALVPIELESDKSNPELDAVAQENAALRADAESARTAFDAFRAQYEQERAALAQLRAENEAQREEIRSLRADLESMTAPQSGKPAAFEIVEAERPDESQSQEAPPEPKKKR